jgi:ABC-type phosphate/phosphonate transport system substrate-binding protein
MYLESFGLDADHLFAQERFAGSHAAVGHALASGEVDVVATHSGRASDLAAVAHARVLASVGPLPAELIVTSPGVARESKLALTHTLMNARLGRFRFTLPRPRHLALFDLLRLDPGLAIPTPRESGVALVG